MKHPLEDLISAKIKEAEEAGMFDGLSGAGKPLAKVDDPANAYFNQIMRDNGAVPEFVRLSKELEAKRAELRGCSDRTERKMLLGQIAELEPRVALAKEAWCK